MNVFGHELRLVDKHSIWVAITHATRSHPIRIATVNAEFLLEARNNPAFADTLRWMTHCTLDGSGPALWMRIGHMVGRSPKPPLRYAGATLVADILSQYKDGSKSILLLGGGSAEAALVPIRARFPSIAISSLVAGIIDPNHPVADQALIDQIQASNPDILLVGFGAPKQELWIRAASEHLATPVMIGVGGSFSFYTTAPRAPKLIQALGLEWLWRVATVPGHWRRAWRAVVLFSCVALGYLLSKRP